MALGSAILYIFYRVWEDTRIYLQEPNSSILAAEIAAMAGIMALGVAAAVLGIKLIPENE